MKLNVDTLDLEKKVKELKNEINNKDKQDKSGLLAALGNVYLLLSERKNTKENLINALSAFNEAEKERKNSDDMRGTIENAKGFIFFKMSFLENKNENIKESIRHYEKALKFRPKEKFPYKYATTKFNLGNAYLSLRDGREKENTLKAIKHFEDSLSIEKESKDSLELGGINNGLGLSYLTLAEISQDKEEKANFLKKSIYYFSEASQIFIPQSEPEDYALTQSNLGVCFSALAELGIEKEKNLRASIEHYKNALKIYTIDESPLDYGTLQYNLGLSYHNLGNVLAYIEKKEMLHSAEEHLKRSIEAFPPDKYPEAFARSKYNLGIVYRDAYAVEKDKDLLLKEIDCLKDALKIFKEKKNLFASATSEFYIGQAFYSMKDKENAVIHYKEAEKIVAPLNKEIANNIHSILKEIEKL